MAEEEEEEERCYHCSQLASTAQTGDGSRGREREREGSIYNVVGPMAPLSAGSGCLDSSAILGQTKFSGVKENEMAMVDGRAEGRMDA